METAAQVIDTTSKRKGLVNAATIAYMIAMPKKSMQFSCHIHTSFS